MRNQSSTRNSGPRDDKREIPPPAANSRPSHVLVLIVLGILVAAATLWTHWPALSAGAVSFDDEEAIVRNTLVQNPSWHSVERFFSEVLLSSVVRGYYRPLTLTSLMLDWSMGGRPDNFYPFHRTSLALHLGSTLLLMLLCYQVFRQPVVAAMVALLFGVHPLTVEPIAWVMERKTILAAFFAFACLCAYVRYAHVGRRQWLVLAVLCYLLSLLAKPTATPLPIVLLLMDHWPLHRLNRHALLEKIPFFLLAGLFAVLACICEQRVNPLSIPAALSPLHLPLRICYLIPFYFSKILLPINLSSVYMLPAPLSLRNPIVAVATLATILLVALLILSRRRTPALWVGTSIFLIGLAPTMGFVGYTWVIASDKYVYLPAVGLLLILAWILERIWIGGRGRAAAIAIVLILAGLLAADTRAYLGYWRTSDDFIEYMLARAPHSPVLHVARGWSLFHRGHNDAAIREFTQAIEAQPNNASAYINRAAVLSQIGRNDQAIEDCSKAIQLKPDAADAYNNRGVAWGRKGNIDQQIRDYTQAIDILPGYMEAYLNRAEAFGRKNEWDQSIRDCNKVIELQPNHAIAYYDRAAAWAQKGDYDQAIRDCAKAIEHRPDWADAYENRAVAWFCTKQYDKAWADVKTCRRLGRSPRADLIKSLTEATGRTE